MFLQVCMILFTGGEVPDQVPLGTRYTPQDQVQPLPPDQVHPPDQVPPPRDQVHTPQDQVHPPDKVHPPGPGTPPKPGTPPGTRYTPRTRYTPQPVHPTGPGTHPPGPGTPRDQVLPRDQEDMVYVRAVRILLECNLVSGKFMVILNYWLMVHSHLQFIKRELLRELFSPRNRDKWVQNSLLNFSVRAKVDQIASMIAPKKFSITHYFVNNSCNS